MTDVAIKGRERAALVGIVHDDGVRVRLADRSIVFDGDPQP